MKNRFMCLSRRNASGKRGQTDGLLFTQRDMLRLILPLMVEQTFISLMGMADTLMVSSLGEAEVSAVNCVDAINVFVLLVFEAVALGGNVICARAAGRKDDAEIRDTVSQLLMLILCSSTLLGAGLFLGAAPLFRLLYPAAEPDVVSNAVVYFQITAVSFPFLAVYTGSAALYRSVGNSRLPVIVVTAGNVLNVAGNAVLIFVCHMGVAGAAWATLASRVFTCLVLLICQARPGERISLTGMRGFRFNRNSVRSILQIGIPGAVENGMFQIGKIVVLSMVVSLGTTASAAQAIITQVETLGSRPSMAVCIGLLTVAGQYIGAGRPEMARKETWRLTMWCTGCNFITSILMVLGARWICSLTALTPAATELVFRILCMLAVAKVVLWPGAFVLQYTLKAAGDVKFPMVVTVVAMWLCRIVLCWVLCRYTALGLWGVWIGWVSDWVIRDLFFYPRVIRGKWMGKATVPSVADR